MIGEVRAPLFMVHGERDRIVPVRPGRPLFAAATDPKEALYLAWAGHNDLPAHGSIEAVIEVFGTTACIKSGRENLRGDLMYLPKCMTSSRGRARVQSLATQYLRRMRTSGIVKLTDCTVVVQFQSRRFEPSAQIVVYCDYDRKPPQTPPRSRRAWKIGR